MTTKQEFNEAFEKVVKIVGRFVSERNMYRNDDTDWGFTRAVGMKGRDGEPRFVVAHAWSWDLAIDEPAIVEFLKGEGRGELHLGDPKFPVMEDD